MNIYARYFDYEVLTHSLDELLGFLRSLRDISLTPELIAEITQYERQDKPYPKRIKVRPRVYFILIKTEAQSLAEFKSNNRQTHEPEPIPPSYISPILRKESRQFLLQEQQRGWYLCYLTFKRVALVPGTQKFQYRDTRFGAYIYAQSGLDAYDRMIGHLKERQDVDQRSQFPSSKNSNFSFTYVGQQLPTVE